MQKSVMLGGPMEFTLNREKSFTHQFKKQILNLNDQLTAGGYQVFSPHIIEDFGKDTSQFNPQTITQRDFAWMKASDAYIALYIKSQNGEFIRSDGTHIELGWASAMQKPIIFVGDGLPQKSASTLVKGLESITQVYFITSMLDLLPTLTKIFPLDK